MFALFACLSEIGNKDEVIILSCATSLSPERNLQERDGVFNLYFLLHFGD